VLGEHTGRWTSEINVLSSCQHPTDFTDKWRKYGNARPWRKGHRSSSGHIWFALFIALVMPGCASIHYRQTPVGQLKGKIIVQVLGDDRFIFVPHDTDPLAFVRADGRRILPSRPMFTDGGSIPRLLWALRNYSPWGYAHAFILHDWLFEAKRCHIPEYSNYTVEDAARAMSEVMKTYIEAEGGNPARSWPYTRCSKQSARR
jgi:Protein of unknown function (DUF1353)